MAGLMAGLMADRGSFVRGAATRRRTAGILSMWPAVWSRSGGPAAGISPHRTRRLRGGGRCCRALPSAQICAWTSPPQTTLTAFPSCAYSPPELPPCFSTVGSLHWLASPYTLATARLVVGPAPTTAGGHRPAPSASPQTLAVITLSVSSAECHASPRWLAVSVSTVSVPSSSECHARPAQADDIICFESPLPSPLKLQQRPNPGHCAVRASKAQRVDC